MSEKKKKKGTLIKYALLSGNKMKVSIPHMLPAVFVGCERCQQLMAITWELRDKESQNNLCDLWWRTREYRKKLHLENWMRKQRQMLLKLMLRCLLKTKRCSITELPFSDLVKTIQGIRQEKFSHWLLGKKKLPSLCSVSYVCAQTSWRRAAGSSNISVFLLR